jgi:hypothetical protein
VIATADACGEAMSPLSVADAVDLLTKKNQTIPSPGVFSVWHRHALEKIDFLARSLDGIPTPPIRSSRVTRDAD